MLLAIDIGNSNISVGLFDRQKDLRFLASLDTDSRKTADQISIDLLSLFTLYGCDIKEVSGAIVSSVVPQLNFMMEKALTRLLGKPPMVVGAGIKTGLMGPMAGIGDSLIRSTLKSTILAIACTMALAGNVIGAFIPMLYPIIMILVLAGQLDSFFGFGWFS